MSSEWAGVLFGNRLFENSSELERTVITDLLEFWFLEAWNRAEAA